MKYHKAKSIKFKKGQAKNLMLRLLLKYETMRIGMEWPLFYVISAIQSCLICAVYILIKGGILFVKAQKEQPGIQLKALSNRN